MTPVLRTPCPHRRRAVPAAAKWGLGTGDLVDDDWSACHTAARRLRAAGVDTIRVPSAALPGTENLVLFAVAERRAVRTVPDR